MAPDLSRAIRRTTFALMALAAFAAEIAARDGRGVGPSAALATIWIVVCAALGRLVPATANSRAQPPRWVFLLLLALAALPFATEPLRRAWTGDGYPLEIQMVCGLRNVGLGLAACAGWLLCLRLACVVSLFLMLFAAAMTDNPAVMALLGLYTATGSFWMALVYWAGLKSVFVSSDRAVSVEVLERSGRSPWIGLAVLSLSVCGSLAVAVVGPKRAAFALGEWMPTSGGTGDTDPFARYGVGDGPEEVAGDDAGAAGMVETDKMIEDNHNSLIDAVGDMYGPPLKPPKDQERMVAAGRVDVIRNHGRLPENRRPSRDFDTARKGPKSDGKPGSQDARALFEVQGRTPLHIRLVAYESFSAAENLWQEGRKPGSRYLDAEGGDWMKLANARPSEWYASDERHRLKTADLKSNLVPTPALLSRFRIAKVDKPHYYEWDYEGVLALAGRTKTPPGIVVTTDCRTLDPRGLRESAFGTFRSGTGAIPVLGEVPAAVRPTIEKLAREWVGERPRGWPQVEAVLSKLRTAYALDREAVAPPGHASPPLWFLTESHRGPDYQFASAAALALRTLDYPTRVCLGYYAAPEAFDPETDHTPVRPSDLHFWPEVLLGDGQWLVVEPTPGYGVLLPNRTLSERLREALSAAGTRLSKHAVGLAAFAVCAIAVWVRRRRIVDVSSAIRWSLFPGRTWKDQVRGAVALLERRGRWAGRARPQRQTVLSWLRETLPRPADDADLYGLSNMAEWVAYASEAPPPWSDDEVRLICRRVLREWTLKRWRDSNATPAMGACP